MILKKQTATDGAVSYTEVGENTLIGNMIDGLKAPFLKDDEFLPSKASFWASAIYGTGGVAGGSVVARKRQAAGKAPMLKVFF